MTGCWLGKDTLDGAFYFWISCSSPWRFGGLVRLGWLGEPGLRAGLLLVECGLRNEVGLSWTVGRGQAFAVGGSVVTGATVVWVGVASLPGGERAIWLFCGSRPGGRSVDGWQPGVRRVFFFLPPSVFFFGRRAVVSWFSGRC